MPLSAEYMRLLWNDITPKEVDIIKRLKGHLYVNDDPNAEDVNISLDDFSKYMNLADYGQKRAVTFMKKYKKTTPLSITKDELLELLKPEKGNRWGEQQNAFDTAWSIVDYYKNNDNQTPRSGLRAAGQDNALNFGELTDFFHMFRYLKDNPP